MNKKRRLNKKGKFLLFILIITVFWIISNIIKPKKEKEINKELKVNNKIEDKIEYNEVDNNIINRQYDMEDEIIGNTENGFLITKKNDVYYVDNLLIVNKSYPLPSNYKPQTPYKKITKDYLYGEDYLEDYVMKAYQEMANDASKEGIKLKITSGYRSYSVQEDLYKQYAKRDGKKAADTYSARAGYSEHQSGLCFDLNGTNKNFIKTKEGKWLNDNCYKYGFALRFPEGKTKYTGYMYEGWHFRYVGIDLATKLYNNGDWLSLEEYYGITSEYSD